jgi:hypothetical protein
MSHKEIPNKDKLYKIRSPYRPFTLSAKKELRNAADDVYYGENERVAFMSALPTESVLDQYELTVVRDKSPISIWHTQHGDTITVFDDTIEMNGSKVALPRTKILNKLRSQDRFTKTDE